MRNPDFRAFLSVRFKSDPVARPVMGGELSPQRAPRG
jgi:hypothetical protein